MYQLNSQQLRQSLFQRFWNKVLIGDDCWEWQGSKTVQGQGRLQVKRNNKWRVELASRTSWFLCTRKWPTKFVLHKCDNPLCVRHSHHFLGTQKENIGDMVKKGRENPWQRNAEMCKRGHSLIDENNVYFYDGRRHCRTCRKMCNANRYLTKKKDR